MTEKRSRTLTKAISYRVLSSVITGSLFFGMTQKGWLSVGVAFFDSVVKTGLFYLHERAWMMVSIEPDRKLGAEAETAEAA